MAAAFLRAAAWLIITEWSFEMATEKIPTMKQLEAAGIDAYKLLDAMQADIDEAKSRGVDVGVQDVLVEQLARLQKRYDEFSR